MDVIQGHVPQVLLLSSTGIIVQIPQIQYAALIKNGATTITLVIEVAPPPPAIDPHAGWLTVAEAAALLPGINEAHARVKVSRAATEGGAFVAEGTGRERRIDPASFTEWRRGLHRTDESEDRVEQERERVGHDMDGSEDRVEQQRQRIERETDE